MLVLVVDYVIVDEDVFCVVVCNVMLYVEVGKLVIFGIVLDLLEIGYGYICCGEVFVGEQDMVVFEVVQFVEKLNLEIVQVYVVSGEYYWNSGMFLFCVGCYFEELKKYCLDIFDVCEKVMSVIDLDFDFICVDEEVFFVCLEELVDYVVMECMVDVVVVLMDVGWSDVGFWFLLWEISVYIVEGNVCYGDVINYKIENSYVYVEFGLVIIVGVKDLVVVQIKDVVLIVDCNVVQDVKKVVEQIKVDGCYEYWVYCEVYCLWGKYDFIDVGDCYQVKCIIVKLGEGLLVQMYYYCVEYWVVVVGMVKVIIDGDIKLFGENEFIYILLGVMYCLENLGKILFDLIEVCFGFYFEEDDVVCFVDCYGWV